jgi:hypothetical protein
MLIMVFGVWTQQPGPQLTPTGISCIYANDAQAILALAASLCFATGVFSKYHIFIITTSTNRK